MLSSPKCQIADCNEYKLRTASTSSTIYKGIEREGSNQLQQDDKCTRGHMHTHLGIHGTVQTENGNKFQLVSSPALVVIRVVRRSDLCGTSGFRRDEGKASQGTTGITDG